MIMEFYILVQNHRSLFYASVVMTTVKNCLKCALSHFKIWQPSECNYPGLAGNISSIIGTESCVRAQWKLFFPSLGRGKR